MSPNTTNPSVPPGSVAVDEELIELLGSEAIDNLVSHLRMGGGTCWDCEKPILPVDAVSLIAHLTPLGTRTGFLHFRCGPPQIMDDRRSRRAALHMADYLAEVSSDVQGFVVVRSYPAPHGVLVVSPTTPTSARTETGDGTNLWLGFVLKQGFLPVAADVMDAIPELLPGWTIDFRHGLLVCGTNAGQERRTGPDRGHTKDPCCVARRRPP